MLNLSYPGATTGRRGNARPTTLPMVIFLLGFFFGGHAEANIKPPPTKEEYQLLPAYCRNQQHVASRFYNPDNAVGWQQALGPSYPHIHHLCWGLVQVMRAYKYGLSSPRGRANLGAAIDNYNYTLDRSPDGSIVRPEILTKIGEAYVGLGDYQKAGSAFKQAVEEKPDHVQAYLMWAQFLMKHGKTSEALAIAEEGKKQVPESRSLDKLIADIKGKGK